MLGGRRTVLGAALGAIFLIVAGEFLRPTGELATFIVSAVALLVVLFFPGGFLGAALSREARSVMDATTSNAPVLEVRGLTKRFGGLTAVKNLSLDLRAGEIFGLIGPNGSGKSTAMKSIMGIERPTAGDVIFQGENVAGLPAHKIARKGFGMVFQHSRPLNRQTVLENIMVALLPDSLFMLFADKALTERAEWIANRVGLGAVMDRRPPTLPFADLRRLELAKAIARDPKVVLVDEPFAGLTLAEVGIFSELIRSFRDEGRAVLLVDHNVKSVAALVDRVLAMYLGEEIVTGRADEVMRNETVRRVYLGGAIETSARPETSFKDKVPLLQVENVSVHYGKAQALDERVDPCPSGRVRLGRRPQWRRQDHAVQYHLRLPALQRRNRPRRRKAARHQPGPDRAQRHRAMPGIARIVRRDERARKSRSRRPASDRRCQGRSSSHGCSNCFRFSKSVKASWRRRCPAANSRCWRSAAR